MLACTSSTQERIRTRGERKAENLRIMRRWPADCRDRKEESLGRAPVVRERMELRLEKQIQFR